MEPEPGTVLELPPCPGQTEDEEVCGFSNWISPVKFCPQCGKKAPKVLICTGIDEDGNPCRKQLKPGIKFCQNCGARASPSKSVQPTQQSVQSTSQAAPVTPQHDQGSAAQPAPPEKKGCPFKKTDGSLCSADLAPGSSSCAECATRAERDSTPAPQKTETAAKESTETTDRNDPAKAAEEHARSLTHKSSCTITIGNVQAHDTARESDHEGAGDQPTKKNESAPAGEKREESPADGAGKTMRITETDTITTESPDKADDNQQPAEQEKPGLPDQPDSQQGEDRADVEQEGYDTPPDPAGSPLPEDDEEWEDARPPNDEEQEQQPGSTQVAKEQRRNVALSSDKEEVSVVFRVIISKEFNITNPQKAHIVIRRGPDWNNIRNQIKMSSVRETSSGWMFEGTAKMTRAERNKGFDYKYYVKKREEKKDTRQNWEYLQKTYNTSGIVNRHFAVPDRDKQKNADCFRYDGIAYPEPTWSQGLWNTVKGAVGKFISLDSLKQNTAKDAVIVTKEHLPPGKRICRVIVRNTKDKTCHTAEDFLKTIDAVIDTLPYPMLTSTLQIEDMGLLRRCIGERIVGPILEYLKSTIKDAGSTRTTALAMFVVVLASQRRLDIDTKSKNLLCRAMLIVPDMQEKHCPDLSDLETHFPGMINDKRNLARLIGQLVRESCGDSSDNLFAPDPRWLCCLPLLHFLEGRSSPFQELEPSSEFESVEWWGIHPCEWRKDAFKRSLKAREQMTDKIITFMGTLKQAFVADALLARSVIAALDFGTLLPVLLVERFPIDAMAATLAHHVKVEVSYAKKPSDQVKILLEKSVAKILELSRQQKFDVTLEHQRKIVECQLELIKKLFQKIQTERRILGEKVVLSVTRLLYLTLNHVAVMEENACPEEGAQWTQRARELAGEACKHNAKAFPLGLARTHRDKLHTHVQTWGQLLPKPEDVTHNQLRQELETVVADKFEEELKNLFADEKLEVFLRQSDQIPAFAGILNRLAFESLEDAFKMQSKHISEKDARLVSLLSGLLQQKWQEEVQNETDVLKFVVTWVPMVNYLQRFKDPKSADSLEHLARQRLKEATQCIDDVLESLVGGLVQLQTLRFLTTHSERFFAVVAAAGRDKLKTEKVLRLREHELQAYVDAREQVNKLFDHCREFIKTDDFEDVQRNFEDHQNQADELLLVDVCDISKPDDMQDLHNYKPVVNPWDIPEDILKILPKLSPCFSSFVFTKLFSLTAEKLPWHNYTFWKAFQVLWSDVEKEWTALRKMMVDGSITLAETEKVFSMFRARGGSYKYNDIETELNKMADDGSVDWVESRIRQFVCYTEIKKYVEAAGALLRLRDTYKIKGNFEDIEKIYNSSMTTTTPIRDLDESVRDLCHQLEDLTPQDIHCLKEFMHPRCTDFVLWLKETMTDGLKELNVFVDLALISAGEDPWAVARVNCFHAASTGFAPLMFTKIEDCSHLLQQCRLVFKNVLADTHLPEKLKDTSQWLEWFQDVQKSHGSVEKTSLSQVASINARGVFKIGRVKKDMNMDVHTVIQLDVSKDEETKTPAKHYTYDELLDLQSRLMLVAGQADKGKENVDRFITIMDSLVRLGKTYIQLCGDGCVLFLDWAVKFLCDTTRPVCCTSEFSGVGEEMLKGQRGKQDLEEYIAGVAGFLEHCHKEWLEYVDKKRQEYPDLNMYTVEQLVFLQQQLVKVTSHEVAKEVFPMLSLLKEDCKPHDLEMALDEAMDEVDKKEQELRGKQEKEEQKKEEKRDNKEKVDAFFEELKSFRFSKALVEKALEEIGEPDVGKGVEWCMIHQKEVEEEEEAVPEEAPTSEEPRKVGQKLMDWVGRHESIADKAVDWLQNRETGEETLKVMIGHLSYVWKRFLETVTASGTDFLSLEHLGIVLKCLADKDKREFNRSLPPVFKSGCPNLMLCHKGEVLNAVTYIYMFPEKSHNPLPQPDEVLLCTEETTYEQADIFLRRAFFGKEKKAYCLAFADSLSYDVGEKVEKKIKEYDSQTENPDYKLVVVCTSEREYRAHIVAALGRYFRRTPAVITSSEIRKYLQARFTGVTEKAGLQAASSLDPERLCVRVVKSNRSGVGKTLYKQRKSTQLKKKHPQAKGDVSVSVPLHRRVANTQDIAGMLLEHTLDPEHVLPRVIHIDVSYQVQEGVDHLLYNLLVLGCVMDHHGKVWLRSPMDLYLVETMPLLDQQNENALVHQIFELLPSIQCWSPKDSLDIMKDPESVPDYQEHDCLFDNEEFQSEVYQRPFQYLSSLDCGQQPVPYQPGEQPCTPSDCLLTLLKYCGVWNPSWSELTQFVGFLNKQLMDFEKSVFCGVDAAEDLPGFSEFVLRFLMQMSRDFATRSLNVSEESLAALATKDTDDADLAQYQMKRTWENSPHPYIFFNPDGSSMTFVGFHVDPKSGDLKDQQTHRVLEKAIMTRELYASLHANAVPLTENFDLLPREDRLLRLYRVLGLCDDEMQDEKGQIVDPDDTYELTTDNVKKILAIYMRFRCGIPVIVMGETGCGKTRLIKFLCTLQTPKSKKIDTMVLVKVHGGTTAEDIRRKVQKAEEKARQNAAAFKHRPLYTVLFFDEANTTEAVGAIKEVMCDGTMAGKPISLDKSLKLVAACNPYRKHSDELIQRLENAGLGYHVDADKTIDKLGRVPMRHLVYRVQPLPQSMLPQVWDFGQLDTRVEELYIRQMVRRYERTKQLGDLNIEGMDVLVKILMESQQFMRDLKDECSFVSLRDVERTLTVLSWFLKQASTNSLLFRLLDRKLQARDEDTHSLGSEGSPDTMSIASEDDYYPEDSMKLTKALVLALAICYRAGMCSKAAFDEHIVPFFGSPFDLPGGREQFQRIIDKCQDVFLDNVKLEENIARNQALKDNVFMMVVCIELRIPLFLVGKPGSSKSLAKTIVADAMQGTLSHSDLFRKLKQAQMVSFQCSPLATADGIQGTFRQCSLLQKNKSKETFVSVVVLDEVGLAEDSPTMALKTLHPLLEDGCSDEEVPDDCKRVAFVGISNWALDPAKMNRGIQVQRDVPDEDELQHTAKGICATQDAVTGMNVKTLIPKLAKAYLKIFEEARKKREFFGLRDFYSLVKMVYAFAAQSGKPPSQAQLTAAVRRNFGGLDSIDPIDFFKTVLPNTFYPEEPRPDDPDCSPSGLIKAALSGDDMGSETRYLLLLSENFGGLNILLENLLAGRWVVPIFGSSFPKDQVYTKICININRIKVCMETGQTVILLNLENLYESLYDALNQYYARMGGERYVDLGLGTQRVKCRVHRNFRLIVVAEKNHVYDKFPIPLINRLEKHFLTLNNIMTKDQLAVAQQLQQWTEDFLKQAPIAFQRAGPHPDEQSTGDVFMGYHPETAPAVVLKAWDILQASHNGDAQSKVLERSQHLLLWCATPDAAVRTQNSEWSRIYHEVQQHEHLVQYLEECMAHVPKKPVLAQVTTHSKLLLERDKKYMEEHLPVDSVMLLTLQAFDTEQQFTQLLRTFFTGETKGDKLLLVQCDSGDLNQDLVRCSQYCMHDQMPADTTTHHVVFIVQLPRVAGACFTGFLGGNWHCLHIDELRTPDPPLPATIQLQKLTPAMLLRPPDSVMQNEILPVYRERGSAEASETEKDDQDNSQTVDGDAQQEPNKNLEVEAHEDPGQEKIVAEGELGYSDDTAPSVQQQEESQKGQQLKNEQTAHGLNRPPSDLEQRGEQYSAEQGDGGREHYTDGAATPPLPIDTEAESQQLDRFRPKFVQQMLISCVQSAVSLVGRDTDEGTSRATCRITIMLQLLSENERFCEGIHKMVWSILHEREQQMFEPALWLKKEAAKIESVKKAGTFRRSWMMCLENKITPVLASVIAYLDTSANLDLLFTDEKAALGAPSWKWTLWLNILRNVCHLSYKHMCLTLDPKDLKEFTVQNPGAGNTPFECRLPFSWLVWELVNTAMEARNAPPGGLMDTAVSVVEHSPLGKCLQAVIDSSEENAKELFQCYIADLMHFTFAMSSDDIEAHQLMCHCLAKGVAQLKNNLVALGAGQGLVLLHMLLEEMKPRLQSILDMDDHRPNAVHDLMASAENGPSAQLLATENEMTEDVALLTLLVEELKPSDKQFEKKEGGEEWTQKYNTVAPIIVRTLTNANIRRSMRGDAVTQPQEDEDEHADILTVQTVFPFGDKCYHQLDVVRCLWVRLVAVKLFLDYISPLQQGPELTRKALQSVKLQMLWKLLTNAADPLKKQEETLKKVDLFLEHCNTYMIKGLLGEVNNCMFCKVELKSFPIELPCKHRLCKKCYRDFCPGHRSGECPQCHIEVPVTFDPADCEFSDAVDQMRRYQRQVNGFLMALASQLCFGGQEPPEEAAVKYIIHNYIMHISEGRVILQTKHITLQDDVVDPTPVLRSFLLRLLLKHRERHVKTLLKDELLKKYRKVIKQGDGEEQQKPSVQAALVQLSLLVIYCLEDLYHEHEGSRSEGPATPDNEIWIQSLTEMTRALQPHLLGPAKELDTLESLGSLRYVLTACARILFAALTAAEDGQMQLNKSMKELLTEVHKACQQTGTSWPKKFLIKQVCRDYGMQAYTELVKAARQEELLYWIILEDPAAQAEEVYDRYLVCGEMYKTIRDGLAQIRWGADSEQLRQQLENLQLPPDLKETFVLLAMHREITMSNRKPMPEQHRTQMIEKAFHGGSGALEDKELGRKLCENTLAPESSPLCVKEGQDMATQGLLCLMSHFYIVLRPGGNRSHLLYPLQTLIFRPENMAEAYLPTMPQDDFVELLTVLNEQGKDPHWGAPKVYRCPNGHRYFVGKCGRAVPANARCNECGRKIGGQAYNVPEEGNRCAEEPEDLADQTRTGHILNTAFQCGLEAVPERDLNPIECAITRLFTHAALYLGASIEEKTEQVSALVKPWIPQAEVCQFFWDHLKHDMEVLQKVTGHSADDVYLLLHSICHRMATEQSEGAQVLLESKAERREWEGQFASVIVKPLELDINNVIADGNQKIVSDRRQGENQLLNIVYEVDEQVKEEGKSVAQLHTSPAVWCYRPRITIDHFFREFQSQVEAREDMKDMYKIIRLFKAESHILRALHYVPAILDGQKRLMMQLHRRLDRVQATTLKIGDMMGKKDCEGLDKLLTNFVKAWEIVKERLIAYNCLAPVEGFVSLPEEFQNISITASSPLAVLLPATRGPGLCSYILLQYLLAAHDDIMRRYCPLVRVSEADHINRYNRLPEVPVRKISGRHLVGYSPESILPMVLANCNYSLKLGHTTTTEYDFAGFQKQLVDSLFQCKSRVKRHDDGYFPVEIMVYRADTSISRLFKSVREKIDQEALNPAERRQIKEDLRGSLPDICQSIDHLNTALSFLKALGGDPESSLHDFMARSLQMEQTGLSRKAVQLCCLKHVQSLWILLCHERASVLANYGQDAFDEQEQALCEPLSQEQQVDLKLMCHRMSAERLELLLLQLFECIMLRLSQPPDQEFYIDPAKLSLFDELEAGLSDVFLYAKDPVEIRTGLITAEDLTTYDFPKTLQGRHSAHTWLACRKHLAAKRQDIQ